MEVMKMLNKLINNLRTTAYDLRANKGQAVVEALVAITIAVVGLLGIFELLSRSLSLNKVVSDQYAASNLATEGIEVVKNLIDNNMLQALPWNNGISNGIYEIVYNDAVLSRQISADPSNCNAGYIRQNSSPLTFERTSGLYGYGFPEITNYKRAVCVETLSGGNELKINSLAVWTTRGGATFDINLEDHFFNWR